MAPILDFSPYPEFNALWMTGIENPVPSLRGTLAVEKRPQTGCGYDQPIMVYLGPHAIHSWSPSF